MPDNEWNAMLVAAAGEVLETMFFTAVCGPAPAGANPAEPHVTARVDFAGTPSGVLIVSVSEPATRSLAASFLGAEDGEPLLAAQLGGVVCELVNMICGSLLSRVKTEEHFRLSSPELLPNGPACLPDTICESLALGESVDDGSIDLRLALEHHAG